MRLRPAVAETEGNTKGKKSEEGLGHAEREKAGERA